MLPHPIHLPPELPLRFVVESATYNINSWVPHPCGVFVSCRKGGKPRTPPSLDEPKPVTSVTYRPPPASSNREVHNLGELTRPLQQPLTHRPRVVIVGGGFAGIHAARSEEHTSELQSRQY